ncbi:MULTISPECIES: WD40 repeat domain-containing protein [Nostocales]|uniref:Uncharacterized protein n=2 Tax=Nostocales TaxID=1161 RepID=A0A0C1RE95_9CYAN|nr:hypothetical protein [Tolypothrix bouteillei]KAF3886504.1 hypothetical protein DA73_0400014215 [Tolypothrix bouteillei VB521301]
MSVNQPEHNDAVLGGEVPHLINSAVLGGIEGVKKRLASSSEETRIAALTDALQYEEVGLDLVIRALEDKVQSTQKAAYLLLRNKKDPKIIRALQGLNYWSWMECLTTLKYHVYMSSLPMTPDGKKIIFGGIGAIHIWNWEENTMQRQILQGHSDEVNFFDFSSDRQIIIGGSWGDARIKVWNWQTGEILCSPMKEYSLGIHSMAVCSDEDTVIVGCMKEGFIKVWNWKINKIIRVIDAYSKGQVQVYISPDKKQLVSAGETSIKIWNWRTSELFYILETQQRIENSAINFEKNIIAVRHSNKIKIFDLQTKKLQLTLQVQKETFSLALSQDGNTLIAGGRGQIQIWSLQTGKLLHTLYGHCDYIQCVTADNNQQIIVSNGHIDGIKVWGVR